MIKLKLLVQLFCFLVFLQSCPAKVSLRVKPAPKTPSHKIPTPFRFVKDFPTRSQPCDQENLPPTAVDTTQRLVDLRQQMTASSYSAYIIPSEDAHLSEYINPRDEKRQWISGFTGSAGTAVVTMTKAALWTDGRYYEQAENQLDCNWVLMKEGQSGVPSIEQWLIQELNADDKVGANPFLFAISSWKSYENSFQQKPLQMSESIPDLIELIWSNPPAEQDEQVFLFPTKYAGVSYEEKLGNLRSEMISANCEYQLLTRLDNIAWLFNLRGGDIPNTPVFTSYALVSTKENSKVFITISKLADDVIASFNKEGCEADNECVEFLEYDKAQEYLQSASNNLNANNRVWMPADSTSFGMYNTVEPNLQNSDDSTIPLAKGTKNSVEVENMKKAHVIDGLALCEYFKWLEENVGLVTVDEISGATKLEQLRASQAQFKGTSFESISATGPNAAIIHYSPTPETNRNLTTTEVYMIDSGGQYFEGTTDVTRSMHFGQPTQFQKEMFTRALMGLIDAESNIFPWGTAGNEIDILVRRHIWEAGYDFNHGTGHGIGQYLSVHEYPPAVGVGGSYSKYGNIPLDIGMFVSLEPGYYESGSFGLRHENIVHVVDAEKEFEGRVFYTFQAATLAPFQTKMIDLKMMSQQQVDYLNSYHQRIFKEVGAEAKQQNKSELYEWIREATKPLYKDNYSSSANSLSTFSFKHLVVLTFLNYFFHF